MGCALEKKKLGDPGAISGTNWMALAPANYCDPLALKRHAGVPPGGVERRPGKFLHSGDVRIFWNMQRADSGNQHPSADGRAVTRGNTPKPRGFIPDGILHARVQPNVRIQAELLCAGFQIALNFVAAGIHAGPVGIAVKRKRVQVRRDRKRNRKLIDVPRPADLISLFDYQERCCPGLQESDGHAQPGKACAGNQNVEHLSGQAAGRIGLGRGLFQDRQNQPLACHGPTGGASRICLMLL